MYKIIIADASKQVRELLHIGLKEAGFEVEEADNGAEVLLLVGAQKPEAVLVDVALPVLNGMEICKQLRRITNIPLLLLAGREDYEQGIAGLEQGADDVIRKPLNLREAVARVNAVLRRRQSILEPRKTGSLHFEGLDIDMDSQRVVAFGREVYFNPKEMELLCFLAANPGKVFSRIQLLQEIWGNKFYGDMRTVDTHIKRVRQKLNAPPDSAWSIATVWSVGYKFEVRNAG